MSSTLDRLRRSIEGSSSATVLIVGDLMLDQFVVGRVNRISPEAPVPVVEYDHDDYRIGGAANSPTTCGRSAATSSWSA